MQTFFLAPTRQNVGLTSVALGVVRALQRQGLRVGFSKPVAQDDSASERSIHFAREICQVNCPNALSMTQVVSRISAGEIDELLEDIVSLCMTAAQGADVLVIEGLHTDASFSFTTRLNADIARSLQAEMVLVAGAQEENPAAEVKLTASQFRGSGCNIAGAILNKAPIDFDEVAAQTAMGSVSLWGVIRNNPALLAPRTLDVARHLKAEVVVEGEIRSRRVLETVVTGRSVTEVICRLAPCALVVSSGDRDDIMIATALAASKGIQLAGLLLTHSTSIDPRIWDLASNAFDSGLPILRVPLDSFATAASISRVSQAVAADDYERMNVSPPAFRYQLIQKARSAVKRIVLPGRRGAAHRARRRHLRTEGHRPLRAARQARGHRDVAARKASPCRRPRNPRSGRSSAAYVEPMVELRKAKGLTPSKARPA
jgi:phosphate acetyltransferase